MFKNRQILAWCFYDTGHCAFATIVMAVVLPVYYQSVIASGDANAMASWGYASSVALALSALVMPLMGTYIDGVPVKKRFLCLSALPGIMASAALFFAGSGRWLFALACMVLGTVSMSAAAVCYDALLPYVAPKDSMDSVSAVGYGVGYLGAGILLSLDLILMSHLGETGIRLSFVSVALWWAAAAALLALFVREPSVTGTAPSGLRETARTLAHAWQELKQYPEALRFMIAFWLYNDGIGTIVRMAAVFGAGIGISQSHLVGAMLATQFIGVPFALFFAWLAKKCGGKKALVVSLVWYVMISFGAMFITQNWHFWLMALSVGMVQGGSQAISRSLYASMLPPGRSGHFFGIYNVSSKFAGIIGPALCGFFAQAAGSLRAAVGIIAFSFIAGLAVLWGVDIEKGRERAAQGTKAAS